MGHIFTSQGVKADPAKITAIENFPTPTDVASLRRFLGMANYLSKFVPNMSSLAEPLRELVKHNTDFVWTPECRRALDDIRQAISHAATLRYFDPRERPIIQCDASMNGLGAVLTQNGHPIAYASRTLTNAERNYAQIEKELLAVVFALQRFDQYVYGLPTLVESDHRPLEAIVKKPLRDAPKRLQRMLLALQRYDFEVTYRKGVELFIADTLSRGALPTTVEDVSELDFEQVSSVDELFGVSDERIREIAEHTTRDESLQDVIRHIQNGWPTSQSGLSNTVRPYFHFRDELVVDRGIIFKGTRCIVPQSLRRLIMERLHLGHPGVTASLHRARESVFWPGMTSQLKDYIARCDT